MQKGRTGFTVQQKTLSLAVFALFLTASLGVASPVSAGKKDRKKEPEPCPVDNVIRTADLNLLKRFNILEGCAQQTLVAQAMPEEYEEPGDERIASNEATGSRSEYIGGLFAGPNEDQAFGNHIAAQRSDAEDSQPAVYRYGKQFTTVQLAGTGRVVQIVPETSVGEMAPSTAAIGASAAALPAPPAGTGDAEKILYMQPRSYRTAFDKLISDVALRHRVDPLLLHAVIKQESGYKNGAVSHAGARGLMQIMPGTGQSLGVPRSNLHVAEVNVDAGARLLKKLWFKYGGDIDLTLAAYNAGEGAVAKYGNKIPPYRETQNYVRSIKAHYSKLLGEQYGGQPR